MALTPLSAGDPTVVGEWTLRGRLGVGGMGVVFLGIAADGKQAAIKLMHPWLLDDSSAIARFIREVEVAGKVDGPCVARILGSGTLTSVAGGPRPYLACEFVNGPTLQRHIQDGARMSGGTLHAFAAGLATALSTIHQAGITHRDLSPGNVLLDAHGPRVVDFGIARHIEQTAVTRTGTIIGTPGFMSPEQARGDAVTSASDVFSWASLIVFAATGVPPHGQGRSDAVLYRIVHEAPEVPPLDPPLARLVATSLDKRPTGRPAAAELASTLLGTVGDADVTVALSRSWQAPPTLLLTHGETTEQQMAPPKSRSRLGLAIAGMAAILAAGVVYAGARIEASAAGMTTGRNTVATPQSAPSATSEPQPTTAPTALPASTPPTIAEQSDNPEPQPTKTSASSGEVAIGPFADGAPWDAESFDAKDDLGEIAALWYSFDDDICTLYSPTEFDPSLDLSLDPFSAVATQVGDFQYSWETPAGIEGPSVRMSIWDAGDPNLNEYFGEPVGVTEYGDGSQMRSIDDVEFDSFRRLILIPGESCSYELTVDGGRVHLAWAIESMRPVTRP